MGPENHVGLLDGGPDPPSEAEILTKRSTHFKVQKLSVCVKATEPIDYLPFGLWIRVGRKKHKFNRIRQVAPPGEYDSTVGPRRRFGLMSNYFDHLFSIVSGT